MSFTVIIPARLQSQRLPNKVLLPLEGKPIIAHVIERACQTQAARVIVASDSQQVLDVARYMGVEGILTRVDHPSGSDRILEAAHCAGLASNELVINVQGDEPRIPPEAIDTLARGFIAPMSTLMEPLSPQDALCPNKVKIACTESGQALYFSRAPIPYPREGKGSYWRHIGVYAYTVELLQRFCSHPVCLLEEIEKLEQLRVLSMGVPIYAIPTPVAVPVGVDTLEDYERLCAEI